MADDKKKPRTSAAVKNRYNDKAYDRIALVVPKGEKDRIKAAAEKNGESVNSLINRVLFAEVERIETGE
jgi:predicted HicB family RNase H-like nuclease